jgi:nitrogen regulatory protein PII 1
MKMLRAIIRPETADRVTDGLGDAGFSSLTKISVFGRGKQNGITIGSTHYDELPKTMILMVLEDNQVEEALKIIKYKAYTGNFGDGKIFVSPIEDVLRVRTDERGENAVI